MTNTIQVSKGLSVPYCFTTEALENFCVDTDTALTDIYVPLTAKKGQFDAVNSLLFHIVAAGYEDLNETMPYTKEDVKGWLKGKNGVLNYPLFTGVVMIAAKVLFDNNEDEVEEGEAVEKN